MNFTIRSPFPKKKVQFLNEGWKINPISEIIFPSDRWNFTFNKKCIEIEFNSVYSVWTGLFLVTIAQNKFDNLVAKLEKFSKRNPGQYRLRVALFAALGYTYIFLVLAGLLGIIGLLIATIIFSKRINATFIKLLIFLLVPAWAIVQSLWVKFPPPQGIQLDRRQVPKLFALVDDLTTRLKAPRFHKILLNQEFNAAVVQVPRLGIFGWQQNYLLLGLPLMQALSLEQFKGVLAHELGHLSGNHSRFSAWIYRIRKTWLQIYERLHQSERPGTSILFDRFLDWYWPSFDAYSFTLARMNEYEADRCAAQLAGAGHIAEALINVEIKARFIESSFWSDIHKQVEHRANPPENVYSSMLVALDRPVEAEGSDRWLEDALARKTDNEDTHPCLSDRLKALQYPIARLQSLPQPIRVSAAERLLGKTVKGFAIQFDRDWQDAAATPWRQRYGYVRELQNKLHALEQKAQQETLSAQEAWERAFYTLEFRGNEAAIPLLEEVLTIEPDRPEANYALGQILLSQADEAGIARIEKAIDRNMDWIIEGCQSIYRFLCDRDRTQEAQKYRDRANQHYQILLKAEAERNRVTDADKLKPHTLKASEVRHCEKQLAAYSQVKEAYLVEKVLEHFPEKRLFVLGIIRKQGFIESEEAAQKLVDLLVENLDFPRTIYITILNHDGSGHLKKKIRKMEGSLIFKR
ncbi:MAG: M48 family metalloprotease [Cyanobacteriota bacterium]|nr:M48 family metalloprotease [Cyanobacteriota bacterium]